MTHSQTAEKTERKEAVRMLLEAVANGDDWTEHLWECLVLHQGMPFHTSGRSGKGSVEFSYTINIGRNGEPTDELVVDRKEKSKSLTRSSVNLAFTNALEVQEREGMVKGPKRLRTFGASYLYPIFLSWGVIQKEKPDGQEILKF